jgi:hypothetical protein
MKISQGNRHTGQRIAGLKQEAAGALRISIVLHEMCDNSPGAFPTKELPHGRKSF